MYLGGLVLRDSYRGYGDGGTVVGGMAAGEEGTGIRFALLCDFHFPGGALPQRLPFLRIRARSEAVLDRLEQRILDRAAA